MNDDNPYTPLNDVPDSRQASSANDLGTLAVFIPSSGYVRRTVELREQVRRDGLSFESIDHDLRAWARASVESVDLIALTHNGLEYVVRVLLAEFSPQSVSDAYRTAARFCATFNPFQPMIYIFGPDQREPYLFTPVNCHLVRPNLVGKSH